MANISVSVHTTPTTEIKVDILYRDDGRVLTHVLYIDKIAVFLNPITSNRIISSLSPIKGLYHDA